MCGLEELLKERFLAPVFLDEIYSSKSFGGLDFRRTKDVNKALFCKLGWFLATNSERFWVGTIMAKYFPHWSFIRCQKRKSYS